MDNTFSSKYREILIDKSNQVPNDQIIRLTVEQFYDLMHHTHRSSDIVSETSGDIIEGGDIQVTVSQLVSKVNELNRIVQEQNNTIDALNEKVQEQESTIKSISENTGMEIGDWDAETPGIQDPEGNTLGTLMGLNMVEIE